MSRARVTAARGVVVALTLVSFTACYTLRPLEPLTHESIRGEVEIGDHVVIEANNGKVYDLDVLSVGGDSLIGVTEGSKQVNVSYAAIKTMKVSRFSPAKTTGLVAGVLGVLAIAALCIWGCSVETD